MEANGSNVAVFELRSIDPRIINESLLLVKTDGAAVGVTGALNRAVMK
jgi:hypothetical protein